MSWNDSGDQGNDSWGQPKKKHEGPPDLEAALKKLFSGFNMRSGGDGGGFKKISGWMLVAGLLVLGVLYFMKGVYTLDQQERGVVLRFGALQAHLQMPGLRWNPPIMDEVAVVNVTRVNNINHRALMLTEDENIVDITMSVQYLIDDPKKYVVAVRQPRQSLGHAAESALRHVVGSSSMDSVLTEGRQQVADEVIGRIRRYMNLYNTGVQVVKVNIDDSQPPAQVAAAFDDVQAAQEDNQRLINEAEAYRESIVPQARGEAKQQVERAMAYRDQVIARSEGDASRFVQLLKEYEQATEVTRERLYLDTMESIFSNTTKIMIDVEGGNNLLYLPLDQLQKQSAVRTDTGLSLEQIKQLTDEVLREVNNRSNNTSQRGR